MHRNKLLTLLRRYQARYSSDSGDCADVAARFRRFVERQPRCFERDCFDDGHVTGSAVVVDASASSMLMTLHAKLGKWLQLGGHADGECDPLAVACREAEEESGLTVAPVFEDAVDLDIHRIPAHGEDPPHFHYDVRFLLMAETAPLPTNLTANEESLALKWVRLDDVESVTREASIRRMVAKCRNLVADWSKLG